MVQCGVVVAVWCSVVQLLQCGAVCRSALQCAVVCCCVLQCVAVRCRVLQCAAVCCSAGLPVVNQSARLSMPKGLVVSVMISITSASAFSFAL